MVYTFQMFGEADDTLLIPFTLICFELLTLENTWKDSCFHLGVKYCKLGRA